MCSIIFRISNILLKYLYNNNLVLKSQNLSKTWNKAWLLKSIVYKLVTNKTNLYISLFSTQRIISTGIYLILKIIYT